jgi:hypothetical protein
MTTMSDNVPEAAKTNKFVKSDLLVQAPVSSDNQFMFQIFFLAEDQSQDVEVVETDEIDFGEITQRLKLGESVFIKHKNPEIVESHCRGTEEEQSFWYFRHC